MAKQQIKTFQKFKEVPGLNAELDRIIKQILDQIGIMDPAYAELYIKDTSIPVTITVAGTYYSISGLVPGNNNHIVLSSNSMRIKKEGTYMLIGSFSLTHDTNVTTTYLAIFVNGTEQLNIKTDQMIITAGNYESMQLTGLFTLKAQDLIEIKIKADNTGVNTINELNINIQQLK